LIVLGLGRRGGLRAGEAPGGGAVAAGGDDVEGETRAAEKGGRDVVERGLVGDFGGEAGAGGEFFGEPGFDLARFEGGRGGGGSAQEVGGSEGGGTVIEEKRRVGSGEWEVGA